ncbi:MAG: TolC family protein [Pirellulales bacterium]
MSRRFLEYSALPFLAVGILCGCHPTQPFYFFEDGDLSHYLDVATEIEYPDADQPLLDEVTGTRAPLTLANTKIDEFWDISLEEVMRITLNNSKVMRELGGRIATTAPDTLSREIITAQLKTIYDPALVESGVGGVVGSQLSGNGVEAALSEFDARFSTNMFWERNDRPQNFLSNRLISTFFTPVFDQDIGRFTAEISKTAASGGTFAFRNNTIYDANNNPSRALYSDWSTNFEAEFSQPLLQGAGTQYNRIAGVQSFNAFGAGNNTIDGVLIARTRVDQTLADFEAGVRDLTQATEDAYWELYFTYRNLETRKLGRDSAQETWKRVHALSVVGAQGGEAEKEAQARAQYFFFRSEVETASTELYRAEDRLRYTMGLAVADGRLIRPSDEPTTAQITFDWQQIHTEALARRVEIRKQKWSVKKRELELIAARNNLLPRLDAVGRYRWLGLGDDLINTQRNGLLPLVSGSTAFESLTGGEFQEWQFGLQLLVPIGNRRAMSQVRHHQLLLARDRALLEDLELEVSHQLADAQRDIDWYYATSQTHFNRLVASEKEVRAVDAAYEANAVTLDLLLDAQRRRADAETAFYRSLVDYNRAISTLHRRKGSLLEYNNVFLAEGPWPAKAYFDALREARKRDASMYLNYGFTRPKVISRGPYVQHDGTSDALIEQQMPTVAGPEVLEAPSSDAVPELPAPELPSAQPEQPSAAPTAPDLPPQPTPADRASQPRGHRATGVVTRSSAVPHETVSRGAARHPKVRRHAPPSYRGGATLSELVAEELLGARSQKRESVRPATDLQREPTPPTRRPRRGYLGSGVRR